MFLSIPITIFRDSSIISEHVTKQISKSDVCFCFSLNWIVVGAVVGSKIWNHWKTKVETVKLVSFWIHCDCITTIVCLPWQRIAYFVRIEITYFVVCLDAMWNQAWAYYALWFHLYRIVHVILSTGSNMIRGASKFLCFCRYFFFFIETQPSKQFILNLINKLCDSSTLITFKWSRKMISFRME